MARKQQGVALITVLLVVAIATSLCTAMLVLQQHAISRTMSLLDGQQSWQYDLAAESFAIEVLAEDARNDAASPQGNIDTPYEIWAQSWPPFPVDGGSVSARIEDEQGRFNLNNIYSGGSVNQTALNVFQRLLSEERLDPNIASAVVDWLDPDNTPTGSGGAESDWYMRLDPPYRAANRSFADVSELRQVRGVDAAAYQVLEPLLCALPSGTPMNLNTLKPEVLAALFVGLSVTQAQGILRAGAPQGYSNVDNFMSSPLLGGVSIADKNALEQANLVSVNSQYFRVSAKATIDARVRALRSWIHRLSSSDLEVVKREQVLPNADGMLMSSDATGATDSSAPTSLMGAGHGSLSN